MFASPTVFDFSLSGRTHVPASRFLALTKMSMGSLSKEAKTIRSVEKRLMNVLSIWGVGGDPQSSFGDRLRQMDSSMFSDDHQWREIFKVLHGHGSEMDAYRRIALAKYIQYLSSRYEVVKYLYATHKKQQHAMAMSSDAGSRGAVADSDATAVAPGGMKNVLADAAPVKSEESQLERLATSEEVKLTAALGKEIDLFLSKHRCTLIYKNPVFFCDQKKRRYHLSQGENLIGRDISCNIIMDSALRDVSRVHLIINLDENNQVSMTDVSSHGTYVRAEYLQPSGS